MTFALNSSNIGSSSGNELQFFKAVQIIWKKTHLCTHVTFETSLSKNIQSSEKRAFSLQAFWLLIVFKYFQNISNSRSDPLEAKNESEAKNFLGEAAGVR